MLLSAVACIFQSILCTVRLMLSPANADKSRNMFIVVAQRFFLCMPTTTAATTSSYTRVAYKTNIDFVAVAAAAVLVAVVHADGGAAAAAVAGVGAGGTAAADGAGQRCGAP